MHLGAERERERERENARSVSILEDPFLLDPAASVSSRQRNINHENGTTTIWMSLVSARSSIDLGRKVSVETSTRGKLANEEKYEIQILSLRVSLHPTRKTGSISVPANIPRGDINSYISLPPSPASTAS